MLNAIIFKGSPAVRIALYLVSIAVNAAAIIIRPAFPEWADGLQYAGGALATFTGIVALSNVDGKSKPVEGSSSPQNAPQGANDDAPTA